MQKRVKRGIRFLDKTLGRRKWVKKIRLNKLDLSDPNTCVIGEIFGGYTRGLEGLNKDKKWGRKNGFNLPVVASVTDKYEDFQVLTRLWKETLAKEGIK